MAKKQSSMKDILSKNKDKKTQLTQEQIENATKQIKAGHIEKKEPVKRLSIDVPISLHKAIKQLAMDSDMTIKELVLSDLRKKIK